MITKGERTELRSVVKNQFKVLRSEVEQREAELLAEFETQLNEKFAKEDKAWNDAMFLAQEATREANRAANDAFRKVMNVAEGYDFQFVSLNTHRLYKADAERTPLRQEARAQINAKVRAARLQLDRQEADLLKNLSVGALESEEAYAFLNAIPTVGELVPAARLEELEAKLDGK